MDDLDMRFACACVDDDVPCKCRSCEQNKANDGACMHCLTCICGDKAMDVCLECKSNRNLV